MNEITINKTNKHTEIKISIKGKLDNKIIDEIMRLLDITEPKKEKK